MRVISQEAEEKCAHKQERETNNNKITYQQNHLPSENTHVQDRDEDI